MSSNLTHEQARQILTNAGAPIPEWLESPKQRLAKFGNVPKEVDGIKFQSTLEARAYQILKLWESAGIIRGLELQPAFILQAKQPGIRAIKYIADFSYVDCFSNKRVFVDTKGKPTREFLLKMKLFRVKYPDVDLRIWDNAKVKDLERGR